MLGRDRLQCQCGQRVRGRIHGPVRLDLPAFGNILQLEVFIVGRHLADFHRLPVWVPGVELHHLGIVDIDDGFIQPTGLLLGNIELPVDQRAGGGLFQPDVLARPALRGLADYQRRQAAVLRKLDHQAAGAL